MILFVRFIDCVRVLAMRWLRYLTVYAISPDSRAHVLPCGPSH